MQTIVVKNELNNGAKEVKSRTNGRKAIFHSLKFYADKAVVLRLLKHIDTGDHRHDAVTDDRAADIILSCGIEEAVGLRGIGTLEEKVLRVHMEGVGYCGDGRVKRIGIGTEEVTHIDKPTVVLVVYRTHKRFYALGCLEDLTVIFGAGADALCLRVFRDTADVRCHDLDGILPGEATVGGQSVANIVTHYLRAECLGNIYTAAQALNLGIDILLEEIAANGICADFKTDFFAVLADFLCAAHHVALEGEAVEIKVDELNAVEAEFLREIADIDIGTICGAYMLCKAITGNADFHFTPQR